MAMNYGGIMYFPLNVNFFDDAPIELVEAKCGLAGITAVIKLLCKMYKEKGYYLLWDKEQCTLFAHKTGIEETNMEKIICILIDKGFFDRKYYEEQYVLTSATIQKIWLEATKRRKRDLNTLPYLLESCIQDEENSIPNKEYCMQPVNISSQNADISEQSKVKQIKAETEEGSSDEHSLLPVPEYAYNKQTHNYDGLIFTLRQMKITKNEEVNAILRLSDYGRLKGYVWQVIHNTRWSEIVAKGKYLIAALVKEKKKTGN
ncbi:DUF4373 domain-containing protein [Bacteroides clarus]|nr:DUF4373 domain-containing protein [Bacteroides clarus]